MAGLLIQGSVSAVTADVDTTLKALRTSGRPPEALGWIGIAATSGAATVIAAAGPVFAFRNLSSNLILVRKMQVGFATTTAFTTAQSLRYDLIIARSFTVSDSGGTAIAVTGSQNKLRTSLSTPTSLDVRIATTAALTAGTRTLDTVALGMVVGVSTTVGTVVPMASLFEQPANGYPIVLAQNEGLIVANGLVMGAAGVGNILVSMEFAEVTAY